MNMRKPFSTYVYIFFAFANLYWAFDDKQTLFDFVSLLASAFMVWCVIDNESGHHHHDKIR